jgi:hypothetical protein
MTFDDEEFFTEDKWNEVYFKEMLTLEEQLEYAYWIDTLVEHGCSCLETLSPQELDMKMYRMAMCDINQETRKDIT